MRRQLLQFGAFLLLRVCLCGHIAETFDFWDHTLQTGSDIEYSVVIVALVLPEQLSPETVQEFQVVNNALSAEWGRRERSHKRHHQEWRQCSSR